jgi:hypothetical protein
MAIRLDGRNSGHGHPLVTCMLLHVWDEHPQPRFPSHAMAHRLHVEQCAEARFSGRGLWRETDNRVWGKTATGKLTSSIGFFPVIFVLRRVLFLRQSGNGTLPSLSWRLHKSGLRRCTWGGRGCCCKGDMVSLLRQDSSCTGNCHHHGGVEQSTAPDVAADQATLYFMRGCLFSLRCAASL